MVLFKIIGENKKTKLRENENIYTTPVFNNIDFRYSIVQSNSKIYWNIENFNITEIIIFYTFI